jgi:hypothetical protein
MLKSGRAVKSSRVLQHNHSIATELLRGGEMTLSAIHVILALHTIWPWVASDRPPARRYFWLDAIWASSASRPLFHSALSGASVVRRSMIVCAWRRAVSASALRLVAV